MSFGLTEKGFKRKRYADIIEEKESRARELFGENVNLGEQSPLGLFIRLNAWEESLAWQVAEDVYFSAFVDSATGTSLDRVAQYIGIVRSPATRAAGAVKFEGDNGTVIEEGFLLETEDGIQFKTTEEVEIDGGEITAEIRAVEPGTDGNVPANTITEIVNPIEGLDSVKNDEETTGGSNKETDAELRERYINSVAKGGASTVDSIRASLLDTEGVRSALVIVNSENEEVDGRPPKSFESYVLGGEAEDIAKTILQTGAAGIQAYGQETETVEDDAGQEHTIGFTYATEVDIYVDVTVTTNEEYPEDGDESMVTEIVKYIGGEDEDGQVYTGLSMGDDVIYTQIIKACYRVPGVEDVDVNIGTSPDPTGTENISIDTTEVAETAYEKVGVTNE